MALRGPFLLAAYCDIFPSNFNERQRETAAPGKRCAQQANCGALCRAGLPDLLILFCGKLIAVELKSRGGRCSPAQRLTREALIAADGAWWEARSANAAMWALAESGATFRMIAHRYGIECWRQPALAPWRVPRRDPAEPRPSAPEVVARRRASQRRGSGRRLRGSQSNRR
jgi:hypothetical protein